MAKLQSGLRVVRAAGGIVYRRHPRGHVEVLLIHRPHRRDWTFPKGKLERGESHRGCALREVEEETGLRCVIERALPSTTHVDRKGRLKIVRYWIMSQVGGAAEPRNEVDQVLWLALHRAPARLTYARDRDLLEAFAVAFG